MPRLARTLVPLAVGAVALSGVGLVAVTPTAAEAAVGFATLDNVGRTMLPHTAFAVSGRLGNKTPRKVVLKVKQSGRERTLATVRSKSDGTFRFTGLKLAASGQLRAVAPRQRVKVVVGSKAKARVRKAKKSLTAAQKRLARVVRLNGVGKASAVKVREARAQVRVRRTTVKRVKAARTRTVTVKRAVSKWIPVTVARAQSVRAVALPPVAQAGASAAAPATGSVVSAGFVPARPGRAVVLERLTDGAWKPVQRGVQDRSGHGVFTVRDRATYRVTAAANAEAPAVSSAAVTPKAWKLDFEDTFSGGSLNGKKWRTQVRPRGTGMRTCARTDGSSYSVSGGVLRLGVSKDPKMGSKKCTWTDKKGVKHKLPYMRNTQLATEGKYDFRYGFAAARIRVQSAVGMHSSFWSLPNQAAVPGRPDRGSEVDVFEYFGDRPKENGVAAFAHTLQKNGVVTKEGDEFDSTVLMKGRKRYSEEYHVFSLEWTPKQYVFRVDGREFHRVKRNISQADQHLVLSNLTSSYELVDLKKFGDTAKVDWVRVWK